MENINFEKEGFRLVDRQSLPFKVKGEGCDLVLFNRGEDYYLFESRQLSCEGGDFLSFCAHAVHPTYYQFKYGDDFFERAKEFHNDLEFDRFERKEKPKSFSEDFKDFENKAEGQFEENLGKNRLYPVIVLKEGGNRWRQYNDLLNNNLSGNDSQRVLAELKRFSIAIFCLKEDNSITLVKHYTNDLSYNILRGKGEIGNLIEVCYGPIKLLLDCGKALEEDMGQESEIESEVLSKEYDRILISHYHLDHAALAGKAKGRVMMGRDCFKVLSLQNSYQNMPPLKDVEFFEAGREFSIKKGDFEVTVKPILVDHSAYDSYMFLIKGGDKTLLYTGDFRDNGRKSFDLTLKALPDKVDILICEATNMFSQRRNTREVEIEKKATALMANYKHVFIFQAGTNIDRLVSFYKASRKNKKVFLIDSYVAGICENLPNIPNTKTFKDVYCFCDIPQKLDDKFLRRSELRLFFKSKKGLGSYDIGSPKNSVHGDLSNFTMLVRPRMLDFLKRIDRDKKSRFNSSIFDNSLLIYSLWRGYKEKEDVKQFLAEMEGLGVKIVDLHTSGHADRQTIDKLIGRVNPGVIEYVHYLTHAI